MNDVKTTARAEKYLGELAKRDMHDTGKCLIEIYADAGQGDSLIHVQELRIFWDFLNEQVFTVKPQTNGLFNQYNESCAFAGGRSTAEYDLDNAHMIRRGNLYNYLASFQEKPSILVVGEAPGYQGVRFSGVPFTSEKQLCEGLPVRGTRSSKEQYKLHSTPTSKKFWAVMGPHRHEFLAWNSIPFHPYKIYNLLSNRPPRLEELKNYSFVLSELARRLRPEEVIAVGNNAEIALKDLNIGPCRTVKVTHPAARCKYAGNFERQMTEFWNSSKTGRQF